MSLLPQEAEQKMEKAIKTAIDDEPQIDGPETEDGKIKLSSDIIRKFLEWVPLENLPNVTLTNRRFWSYCDENLEKRKYVIQCLYLSTEDSSSADQLQVDKKMTTIDGKSVTERKTVEFAEVAPPANFQIKRIEVTWNVGERAMDFLRLTADEQLYVGAKLALEEYYSAPIDGVFYSTPPVDFVVLDKFLRVFDKCAEITIERTEQTEFSHEFFSKPAISNCNQLRISTDSLLVSFDFDQNAVFNWLHSPPTVYPDALPTYKHLIFDTFHWGEADDDDDVDDIYEESLVRKLLPRITEMFLEDDKKTKFMVGFACEDDFPPEIFYSLRQENPRTGELLFSRIVEANDCKFYVLVRCLKEEEDTISYKEYSSDKKDKSIVIYDIKM